MTTTPSAMKGRVFIDVGDGNAYEVGTIEFPVTVELQGSALGVKNIDLRRPLAHALKDAGETMLAELNKTTITLERS